MAGTPQPSRLLRAPGTPQSDVGPGAGVRLCPPPCAPRSVWVPAARGCVLGDPAAPRPPPPPSRVPEPQHGRAGGRAPPHPQPRFGGGGAVLALRARRDPRDDENQESFPQGEGVPSPAARPGAWQAPGSCGLPRAGLGRPGSRGCGRGPGSSGAPAPGDALPQGPGAGGAPPRRPQLPAASPAPAGGFGCRNGAKRPKWPHDGRGTEGPAWGLAAAGAPGSPPGLGSPGVGGRRWGQEGRTPAAERGRARPGPPGPFGLPRAIRVRGGSAVSSPLGATTRPPPARGSLEPCTCPRPLDPTAGGQWGQAGLNPPGQGH